MPLNFQQLLFAGFSKSFILCILWLLPGTGQVYGQGILDQPVDMIIEQAKLPEILSRIHTEYAIDFYYDPVRFPEKSYQTRFQQTPLKVVLETLLQGTDLAFAPFENYAIVIVPRAGLEAEFTQDYYQIKYGTPEVVPDYEAAEEVILGDPQHVSPDGMARIEGKVTDLRTEEPLIGVALFIPEINRAVVTNVDGSFSWELPIGQHELLVQSIGYEDYKPVLQVYSDATWDLQLLARTYDFDAVVITDEATDANVASTNIGLERLSPQDIRQLPSLLGEADVIRSLLTLPGVSTVGEGATGFNVRGGNIDQNLVLQDGAPVYTSSHVLGFFSIFNPDLVRSVSLYKGHIPAMYGGRTSSLLEVETIDADPEQFHIRGGVGIVSSKLAMEIPLIKGKTSLLLGGRNSYSDWMLRLLRNNPDVRSSSVSFYDLNAKITHRFSNGSKLSAGYYRSQDFMRYSNYFGFRWGLQTANLQWNQLIAEDLSFDLSLNFGETSNISFDPEGIDGFELATGIRNLKVRPNLFISRFEGHRIHIGGEWQLTEQTPEELTAYNDDSAIVPATVEKDRGAELSFYINDEFDLGPRVNISAGLRYSRYRQLGEEMQLLYGEGQAEEVINAIDTLAFTRGEVVQSYEVWEPRISLRYRLSADNSVKLSYNRLHQFIHLVSNTVAATPVDIWQLSTPYIPPQRSDNFSIGYFHNFDDNEWETSVEAFYRDMDQLSEVRDLPQILLNDHMETELLPAIGRAYGTEVSIRRTSGRTTGRISYSWTRSLRRTPADGSSPVINQGNWYPSNFDQPHSLKLTLTHQVNKRHTFSANFVFNSGRPITAPIANFFIGSSPIPLYSERNALRIPAYHRLDISYTIRRNAVRAKRYKGSLTFSIYNLYGRENVFTVFFQRNVREAVQAYQFSVLGSALPAVTYNFTF